MRRLGRGRWLLYAAGAALGLLATIVIVFALLTRRRAAELRPWHRLELTEEFRAGGDVDTFEEYRALEGRLTAQERRELIDDPARADTYALGRYNPKSIPGRLALETPFNMSFELEPEQLRGAALLVHGLTDSPYAMRSVGRVLQEQGFYVLALRLPGHGTIPSGLLDVDWKDWYAAVELAAQHVAARAGSDKPFYVGGYSTGAALATMYSLRSLKDASLPRPTRLIALSAAIGIPSSARLTRILASLGILPCFEQSKWLDVAPEYDPYKYNSFPVNAARQIYDLTIELAGELDDAGERGALAGMPKVLAFQSLVDATVTARDVAVRLLGPLTPNGHELVVFDVNRRAGLEELINRGLRSDLDQLRSMPNLPFRLVVLSNRSPDTDEVELTIREAGEQAERKVALRLSWPRGVLSLGHVALPFETEDPIYGLQPGSEPGRLEYPLGALGVRGESGTLVVALGDLARMRCNPFFAVVRARLEEAVRADLAR